MIMATPIAPTPTLTGKAAEKFLQEIQNPPKISKEKRERIKKNAAEIEQILTFEFWMIYGPAEHAHAQINRGA